MTNDERLKQSPKNLEESEDRSPLRFFSEHRRLIIVAALIFSLGLLVIYLPKETLVALLENLLAQKTLMVLLTFFSLLTLSLLWSASEQFDVWVFLYFNQHNMRGLGLDRLMWVLTQIGNGLFGLILAGIFFISDYRRLGIILAMGILSLWLVVEMIKALTDRDRPFLTLSQTQIVGWRAIGRSFPSGHTSQTFFMVTLFVRYFQLNAGVSLALYILAALVGFTRIYIGVHYPRDALAGAILGSVWGILGIFVLN
jgi:membrane-associated phospholipid phosphatase